MLLSPNTIATDQKREQARLRKQKSRAGEQERKEERQMAAKVEREKMLNRNRVAAFTQRRNQQAANNNIEVMKLALETHNKDTDKILQAKKDVHAEAQFGLSETQLLRYNETNKILGLPTLSEQEIERQLTMLRKVRVDTPIKVPPSCDNFTKHASTLGNIPELVDEGVGTPRLSTAAAVTPIVREEEDSKIPESQLTPSVPISNLGDDNEEEEWEMAPRQLNSDRSFGNVNGDNRKKAPRQSTLLGIDFSVGHASPLRAPNADVTPTVNPFVGLSSTVNPIVGAIPTGMMAQQQATSNPSTPVAPQQSTTLEATFGSSIGSTVNPFGDFSIGRHSPTATRGLWSTGDLHKNRMAAFGHSRTPTIKSAKHLSKSSANRSANRYKRQQNPPTPLFASVPAATNPLFGVTPPTATIAEPPSSVFRMQSPTIQQPPSPPKFKKGDKIVFTKENTHRLGEIVHVDMSMGQPYNYCFEMTNHDGSKTVCDTTMVDRLRLA